MFFVCNKKYLNKATHDYDHEAGATNDQCVPQKLHQRDVSKQIFDIFR